MSKRYEGLCKACGSKFRGAHRLDCPLLDRGDTERDRRREAAEPAKKQRERAATDKQLRPDQVQAQAEKQRERAAADKQRRPDQVQAQIANLMSLARSGSELISPKAGRRLLQAHANWERSRTPGAKLAYDEALAYATKSKAYAAGSVEIRRRMAERLAQKAKPEQQPAYQATLLTWRVLPPGRRIVEYIAAQHIAGQQGKSWDRERLALLDSLTPLAWYEGAHLGQTVYFVAVFERVAIADTPEWGNALYYCASDQGRWQSVFRLEKLGAVASGARRIVHSGDWKARVRRLVQQ